jgi:hypothetical protein
MAYIMLVLTLNLTPVTPVSRCHVRCPLLVGQGLVRYRPPTIEWRVAEVRGWSLVPIPQYETSVASGTMSKKG